MVCVLLIEDHEQTQRLVGWILKESGYVVTIARDAEEAAQKLGTEVRPEIIVINTDKSPDKKQEIIEALRSLCPNAKVIDFAIGANRPQHDTGADEYLSKPFVADELLEKIERLVG